MAISGDINNVGHIWQLWNLEELWTLLHNYTCSSYFVWLKRFCKEGWRSQNYKGLHRNLCWGHSLFVAFTNLWAEKRARKAWNHMKLNIILKPLMGTLKWKHALSSGKHCWRVLLLNTMETGGVLKSWAWPICIVGAPHVQGRDARHFRLTSGDLNKVMSLLPGFLTTDWADCSKV